MYFLEFYPLNYVQTGTFMLPSVYQGVAVRAHTFHFGKVRNSYFFFFLHFSTLLLKSTSLQSRRLVVLPVFVCRIGPRTEK